jgi:hypothetical protein
MSHWFLLNLTFTPKSHHILESLFLSSKTCKSTLRTHGFQTHVVVGEEPAEFCCFYSKIIPKQEDET